MLRMLATIVVMTISLTSIVAAQEVEVNAADWNKLKPEEQQLIKDILKDTMDQDVKPTEVAPAMTADQLPPEGDFGGWLNSQWNKRKKQICEVGCATAGIGATAGCGLVSGGTAAAICAALATKGVQQCNKKC